MSAIQDLFLFTACQGPKMAGHIFSCGVIPSVPNEEFCEMKRKIALLVFCCLMLFGCPAFASGASGTMLVAFGTSMESAMASLEAIDQSYPNGKPVIWAYTSDQIRKKLKKAGVDTFSVNAAMNECARLGIRELRIQSLHISSGEEFSQLERMIVKNLTKYPGRFDHVFLGHPLLESERDLNEVVEAVLADIATDRQPGDAVVLMGHGNDRGPGDLVMAAAHTAFNSRDSLIFLATVEGANSFDRILPELKRLGVKRVWLQPFMVVAGDHANNDLAGPEEDSWASQIRRAGMTPLPRLKGLGDIQGVRAVFLRHTADTTDDIANSKKSE